MDFAHQLQKMFNDPSKRRRINKSEKGDGRGATIKQEETLQ
jgi:hypothetical protein